MYGTSRRPLHHYLLFLIALAVVGLVTYFTLTSELVSQKLIAAAYYAETYYKKLQPKPALPAPPPASAADAEVLLQSYQGDLIDSDNAPANTANTDVAAPDPNEAAVDPPAADVEAVGSTSPANQQAALASDGDTLPQADSEANLEPDQSAAVQPAEPAMDDTLLPIAPAVTLTGVHHEWQTWNNCGPSTVAMNLSYFDHSGTQVEAAQFLKPNRDDKNVSPEELVSYAKSVGYQGFVGVDGTTDLLKQFLSNDLPVIVEFWTERDDAGGMGHYRLLNGYDTGSNEFIAQDSLHGPDVRVPIDSFDVDWQVFNRTYVAVFPPDQAATALSIAGSTAAEPVMYREALATAQTEARAEPDNPFAWFNVGTNYARLGETALAAGAFDEARRLGLPYRMLWYQFDIFEVYLAQGRYPELIELATAVLQATGGLEELYYYRGLAYQAQGQPEAAAADFEAALDYNPLFEPARAQLD
jgi:tetratricopeptide (TPR) repeat protein